MLYTSTKPTPTTRLLSHLLRNLIYFFSLTLSSCAAQPFLTTQPVSHVQAVKRDQPFPQEPRQSTSVKATGQVVVTASEVFARGQDALQARRYENAIDLFNQAIRLDTTNALYYLWLGRAYGHQAEQTKAGEQFFLARQVRKNLEKAVTLNPDLIEARLDLLTYYLQAPGLLGGGIDKAQAQAEEITKRDPRKGALAKQQCQRAAKEESSLFTISR